LQQSTHELPRLAIAASMLIENAEQDERHGFRAEDRLWSQERLAA
jgi:hypothetical protein